MPGIDLNYLASAMQPGASMPAAVPGSGTPQSFLQGAPAAPVNGPAAPGGIPLPPGLMAPPDPSSQQYESETQQDGTVLLRMKNPDGSLGPVVQIVKVKLPGAGK